MDQESGLVHHAECTAANVADVTQMHKLLHGKEGTACGDSGYTGVDKREEKPSKLRAMDNKRERKYAERWEQFKASVRAKGEHRFRVVRRHFGYTKVRCRGLAKNTAQVLTRFVCQTCGRRGDVCCSRRGNPAGRRKPVKNAGNGAASVKLRLKKRLAQKFKLQAL